MTKVLVLGGNPGDDSSSVKKMFQDKGWDVTGFLDARGVNLVCFCGGTDVNPEIYGEVAGPYTQKPDINRDARETRVFRERMYVPKVGICRGAQLLNVLSGGKMIQHIGHGYSGDIVVDGETVVRVDHHQGMIPDYDTALDWGMYPGDHISWMILYGHTNSLCFQPHPEWGHDQTKEIFFDLLQHDMGVS